MNDDGELSSIKNLEDDSQYTNDKYPEILTNFKIQNRVLKMQEQRDQAGHKREDAAKHSNLTNSQSNNKVLKKRNVKANEPDTVEEIEDSLKHIITELGLSPAEDKTLLNKRDAESNVHKRETKISLTKDEDGTTKLNGENELNEDEDMESGPNKIDIHKEIHDNPSNIARTKKEGKRKNAKKKHHKVSLNEDTDKNEEEEQEESDDNSDDFKRSTNTNSEDNLKKTFAVKRKISATEEEAPDVPNSSGVKEITNYQSEGEAYLRNKRQLLGSSESPDIVKGLESSGELTVSGNKTPLASSSDEGDVSKVSKVTKKSADNNKDSKETDLELEKNIQEQIKAIKEQVKREIEALKGQEGYKENNELVRKKRTSQNTLIDEEKNFMNPQIDEESLKPHKRNKRDFDNEIANELGDCSTQKSKIEKRDLKEFNENNELNKKSLDVPKYFDNNRDEKVSLNEETYKNIARNSRNIKDGGELFTNVLTNPADNDVMHKNLNSRSNEKTDRNESLNDDMIDVNPNNGVENKNPGTITDDTSRLQKRTADGEKKEIKDTSSKEENVKNDKVATTDDKKSEKTKRAKENDKAIELKKNENGEIKEREKRKEDEKKISLYDVAMKKRELPAVDDAFNANKQIMSPVNLQENLNKNTAGDLMKRNAVNGNLNVNKPGINSLYLSANDKYDENVKHKRQEDLINENLPQNADVNKFEARLRRNHEKPNEYVSVQSDGITIMDRMKRNEVNNKREDFDRSKIMEMDQKRHLEKRMRRNEERDEMSEGNDELRMERKKRNEHYDRKEQVSNGIETNDQSEIKENDRAYLNEETVPSEDELRKRREINDAIEISTNERGNHLLIPDDDESEIKMFDKKRKRRHAMKDQSSDAKNIHEDTNDNSPRMKRNINKETVKKITKKNKKLEKIHKSRRDLEKGQKSSNLKQRDVKSVERNDDKRIKNSEIHKRKLRSNLNTQPLLIHNRRKRSENMLYYPYREDEEEVDDEGDEFDDDGFEDRTAAFIRKREIDDEAQLNEESNDDKESLADSRTTKRQNLLHDYVADMNSDTYENPNAYLYNNDRKKRQDFEDDDFGMYHEDLTNNDGRRSIKREASLTGTENGKQRRRLDDAMLDLSDSDLFGSLPQSYEGELTRFKRVKRHVYDHD